MPRSVVLRPSPRCPQCRNLPRWCVCEGLQRIDGPVAVDVLMHHREVWRPSSTGHLIGRVLPGSRRHVYRRGEAPAREAIMLPDRELWILHPNGEPVPSGVNPAGLQVLLLDGNWIESLAMLRQVGSWGRRIGLPMSGESRYRLRSQQEGNRFSTVEALAFLFDALGLAGAAEVLRMQLELHVYAGLSARGKLAEAAGFLAGSPLRGAMPELVARLGPRREAGKDSPHGE